MNWRRLLLWIAFFAIIAAAILVIVRVAKITFGTQRVAVIALLESVTASPPIRFNRSCRTTIPIR